MLIRTFIVEDEYQNRNLLSKMLSDSGQNIQLVGFATNVKEAIEGIAKLNPELVFMDVKLEDETSFEILYQLPEINFELIFITAYDDYALKAFRFNAMDYLLKPLIQS